MASSWGTSWGASWADSWGAYVAPPSTGDTVLTDKKPNGGISRQKLKKYLDEFAAEEAAERKAIARKARSEQLRARAEKAGAEIAEFDRLDVIASELDDEEAIMMLFAA